MAESATQQSCVWVRAQSSHHFLLQENDVTKLYMELAAENKQQLSQLEFAKKIIEKVPAHSSLQDWGTLDWGSNLLSLGLPYPSLSLHVQV